MTLVQYCCGTQDGSAKEKNIVKPIPNALKANPIYIEDFRQRKPLGRLGDVIEASPDPMWASRGSGFRVQHPKTSEACIANLHGFEVLL